MSRTTTATTSIAALQHNLSVIRRQAGGARVWAVVKADAYGHGLLAALRGFAGADGMALIEFDAAVRLREAGWQGPILLLEGAFSEADVRLAARWSLSLVVAGEHQLRWLQALEAGHGGPVEVWLKVNTGLNRLGVRPEEALTMAESIRRCPAARLVGVMTHFANSDVPQGADEALQRFEGVATALRRAGIEVMHSLANSAAVFSLPASHRHWVRPGIVLYGATPFDDRAARALGLQPAMTLSGSLIAIQTLAPGDSVGYGSRFTAEQPMRIGVVDCGYADGYPRIVGSGTPVLVDGVRTGTVGRVSMDMLTVDLGPVPQAVVGSPVQLWGDSIAVDEVAAAAGTVGYELLCAITPRVRRVALG